MSLTQTAVHRPVTVAMLFLGIAVLGLLSLNQISIDFLPPIQVPELMVQTVYHGASPEAVESAVSEPVESTLGTVNGLKRISSISREGLSLVRLEFYWGRDIDYAMLEVREKLDAVRGFLPEDAERPTILRIDPSSESIMTLALTPRTPAADSSIAQTQLAHMREFAEVLVKRRLEQIHGVAQAVVAGGREREIRVEVDAAKMTAYGLNFNAIAAALNSANIQYSGGTLKQGIFRYAFRTVSELETLKDIEQVSLRTPQGHLILLRQIAQVREAFAEPQGLTRVDGREAILLFIRKEAGANTVAISQKIRQTIDQLSTEYKDIKLDTLFAQADFIKKSISDIEQAVFWGALLAFLVLFLFLHHIRYPLIIGIVTPFSILTTVVMMYFAGITFNIISLTGLALGIGMVGDNAIIVVENFSRLRQQGLPLRRAVLQGAKELNVTISAATFTNVAIFLPVIFVSGVTQKLFVDMSLTMTFSLLASLLVAVTLVPALLDRLPAPKSEREEKESTVAGYFSCQFSRFLELYEKWLDWCLRRRLRVLGITTLVAMLSACLALFIPAEQAPDVDQSRFMVELVMPRGSSLPATAAASALFEKTLSALPAIEITAADIGLSAREDYFSLLQADITRSLIEVRVASGYAVSQAIEESRKALQPLQNQFTAIGAAVSFKRRTTTFERILQPQENDITIQIIGNDFNESSRITETILSQLSTIKGLTDVRQGVQQHNPRVQLQFDRQRLAAHHLDAGAVSQEAAGFISGRTATYVSDFDRRIPVRVLPALPEKTDKIAALLKHQVKSGVPIGEVAAAEKTLGFNEIYRENHQRALLIYADADARNILRVISEIKRKLADMPLPPDYEIHVGGKIDEIRQAGRSLMIILLLSIFLVYIILASEYESVLYPLIILVTSPLSVVGAFIAMFLAGQSYNVMSLVGLVIMLGAIDNDTVIALDLIIANRRNGMALHEGIMDGMRKRLRPIIMTTCTTILGIIPLIIGFGAGLELATALSYPVIGGILASTLVAMFVDPVLYSYFDRFGGKRLRM
ncbi:efflux RND transporter permease subunit [candidate division KSB1 bacterium]|nr:efflux RND transporter permease subunit [candidate division KSB1 bacterium]